MYEVPQEKNRWPSVAMAAAMHVGLFVCLWIGTHWESHPPEAVEAEVWDMKVQNAAPPPPPPPEAVEPPPAPAPAPTPPPPPPPPEQVVTPPAAPAPDIALEQLKKKQKAEKERQAELQQQKEQQQKEQQQAEQAAKDAQAKADAKAQAKADAKAKAAADAKAQAQADAKAAAEAKAQQELADKKEAAEKAAKTKARAAAEQKAADKLRAADMARLTAQAGSGTAGTAAQATAPRRDDGYVAAITAKIKSNIAYGGNTDVAGAPRAEYQIDQLPTGEIISVRKIKSSGIPAYDNAVETAIAKSSPLPKRKDGTVSREVVAGFNLKD